MKKSLMLVGVAAGFMAGSSVARAEENVSCSSMKNVQGHSMTFLNDGNIIADLMLPNHPFNGIVPMDSISTEKTKSYAVTLADTADTAKKKDLLSQSFYVSTQPGVETLLFMVITQDNKAYDTVRCKVPRGWTPSP